MTRKFDDKYFNDLFTEKLNNMDKKKQELYKQAQGYGYNLSSNLSPAMKELADVILKMKKDIKFIKKCQTATGASNYLKSRKLDQKDSKGRPAYGVDTVDLDGDGTNEVVVKDRDGRPVVINGYALRKLDPGRVEYQDYVDNNGPYDGGYKKWMKNDVYGFSGYDTSDLRTPIFKADGADKYKGYVKRIKEHPHEYINHKPRKLNNVALITKYLLSNKEQNAKALWDSVAESRNYDPSNPESMKSFNKNVKAAGYSMLKAAVDLYNQYVLNPIIRSIPNVPKDIENFKQSPVFQKIKETEKFKKATYDRTINLITGKVVEYNKIVEFINSAIGEF